MELENPTHKQNISQEKRFDNITTLAFFSNSIEDGLAVLRVLGPALELGLKVVRGSENGVINLQSILESDVTIIQREFPQRYEHYQSIIRFARQAGKPVIYDLDDLLFYLPENHPDRLSHYFSSSLLPMFEALEEADLITVPTPALQYELHKYNHKVVMLPNYLNDKFWKLRHPVMKSKDDMLTIGFMGGHSHEPDLEYIQPVLVNLLRYYPDRIRFHFWGTPPPSQMLNLPQVRWTSFLPYTYRDFSAYFQNQVADILIAPLVDNLFNRCKSSLKFFEYTALGAACILSRLDTYAGVVSHGYNGLLASSLNEWSECLVHLIENDQIRVQLATNAISTVKDSWLLSQNAYRWKEAYNNALIDFKHESQEDEPVPMMVQSINRQTYSTIQFLKDQVNELDRSSQTVSVQKVEIEQELAEIYSSKAWRLLLLLRKIRVEMIPPRSRRERILSFFLQTIKSIRRDGLQFAIQQIAQKFRGRKNIMQLIKPNDQWNIEEDCEVCPLPAVSIFIEHNSYPTEVTSEEVLAWASVQTLPEVEVAIWDSIQSTATSIGVNPHSWNAPDFETFCQGLAGRYLCAASPDLLQRSQNYLEINLIALESENLAFTVNVDSKTDDFTRDLESGYLPGNRLLPYFRQVIRTVCACNDYSIDLTAYFSSPYEQPCVVGKIITHTTNLSVSGVNIYPSDTSLRGFQERTLRGADIIARVNKHIPWHPVFHKLRPVQKVMPSPVESAHMPTVIVFMPFLAMGGAERLALNLIQHLKDQVRFVVVTDEKMDTSLGTTVGEFLDLTPYVYNAADFIPLPSMFSFLRYLIERFQADTFYIANGSNWIYDHLMELRQAYPRLRIVNQVYDHQFGWINRYNPEIAASIDAHISANPNITQAYLERGACPETIHFVEHAIDMDKFNSATYPLERCVQIKRMLGVPVEKKLVTFCARLHPQKRPLDFVELARRFTSDESIHFLIVGDGTLASAVESQIRRIGLKNITRLGFYNPIIEIYAISDVIVLPSEYEAMPLVILETQAMGKPVVATNVGHIQDVITMTQGGIIVSNIGDVASLRLGVIKALHEPMDSARMHQAIASRFGLSHIAPQYRDVWLENYNA